MTAQTTPPPESVEVRMARLEGAFDQLDKRLGTVETRLTTLEQKVDNGFNEVQRQIQSGNNRLTALVLVGILVPILLQVVFFMRTPAG